MQQHRLIRINQDLRHRIGVTEAQGKALIQQRAELEAAAQVHQQELGALQTEVTRLRKELRGYELEREVINIEETSLSTSGISHTPPQITVRKRRFTKSSVSELAGFLVSKLMFCVTNPVLASSSTIQLHQQTEVSVGGVWRRP